MYPLCCRAYRLAENPYGLSRSEPIGVSWKSRNARFSSQTLEKFAFIDLPTAIIPFKEAKVWHCCVQLPRRCNMWIIFSGEQEFIARNTCVILLDYRLCWLKFVCYIISNVVYFGTFAIVWVHWVTLRIPEWLASVSLKRMIHCTGPLCRPHACYTEWITRCERILFVILKSARVGDWRLQRRFESVHLPEPRGLAVGMVYRGFVKRLQRTVLRQSLAQNLTDPNGAHRYPRFAKLPIGTVVDRSKQSSLNKRRPHVWGEYSTLSIRCLQHELR